MPHIDFPRTARKRADCARLLEQAHDAAWNTGRYDVTIPIIQALNCLRGHVPARSPERDAVQSDLNEYADECGVSVRQLIRK